MVELSEWLSSPRHTERRLGSRIRASLICQPPIRKLQIQTGCCKDIGADVAAALLERFSIDPPHGGWRPHLYSKNGFTVGGLLDIASLMCEAHRLCPEAEARLMDQDGYVRSTVCFAGEIEINLEDPRLEKNRWPEDWRPDRYEEEQRKRKWLLKAYRAYKLRGRSLPSAAKLYIALTST